MSAIAVDQYSFGAWVDPRGREPFELGAELFALLAYPAASEIKERQETEWAWCADFIRVTCEAYPEDTYYRLAYPHYASIDKSTTRRVLKKAKTRIKRRMQFAHMALGYTAEALQDMFAAIHEAYPDLDANLETVQRGPTWLPPDMKRHSVNELVKLHFPCNDNADGNIEKRVWRESLPAAHLAGAFYYVCGPHTEPGPIEFKYDLQDLSLHRALMRMSFVIREAFCFEWQLRRNGKKSSSTFEINPAALVELP
jgi:hypothetical protein